ncbi:MAG TPA: asparaginase [Vicinamibacteria bacterium]
MTRRRVYIAYTGGTIGMRKTAQGYAPAPGYLQEQMRRIPELEEGLLPEYVVSEYQPLLDSSNMVPQDWLKIASDIHQRYHEYDGFVVLHGTDTMAYTASALPFLFEGLGKPVVLTGSQIPLCEVRSDARENLITALLIASDPRITEVCLYFGGRLLRGCRSVKVNADGFDAFASPNFPPLGVAGIDIEIDYARLRPAESGPFRLLAEPPAGGGATAEPVVAALRIFPGISATLVRHLVQPPLRGLVLEAYGVGNAPDRDARLLEELAQATARGLVIVVCTQCLRGTVDLGDYATGSALAQAGVVSGYDLTAEAALAKLFQLLQQGHPPAQVKELMLTDLRGELTKPPSP